MLSSIIIGAVLWTVIIIGFIDLFKEL